MPQILRFLAVLATNPLLAALYAQMFSGDLMVLCVFTLCSVVCTFFVVQMFTHTGVAEGSDEIALGELGRLSTEVLCLGVVAVPLLCFVLWAELTGFNWTFAAVIGTPGGGIALLLLLALARKWKAGRLIADLRLRRAVRAAMRGAGAVLLALRGLLTGDPALDLRHPAGRAWVYRILRVCGSMVGLVLVSYLILTNQLLGTGGGYWFGSGRYTAFAVFAMVVTVLGAGYLTWRAWRDAHAFDALLAQIETAGKMEDAPVCVPEGSGLYAASQAVATIGTHLQESVEAQLKSERMKLDLITNVSHDLKTPLTSIIGYLDLLEKQKDLSAEARDYVLILRQKSERLATTVADLFTLAKATSGSETLTIEPLDLVMAVRQTLGDLSDSIRKAGIPVKATMPAGAPVQADSAKLYRVLQNIVDNALRYSLPGTRIYLDVKPGDIATRLTLMNTASYEMTFAPDEILQRFVRGDASRTTEGSGLGLSIAETFMRNFGGDLAVEIHGDQFLLTLTFANAGEKPEPGGERKTELFGAAQEEDVPEVAEEAPETEEETPADGADAEPEP